MENVSDEQLEAVSGDGGCFGGTKIKHIEDSQCESFCNTNVVCYLVVTAS